MNDGEQLYASSLPGYSEWIASANSLASSRSGVAVSHQSMSAYGAYAEAARDRGVLARFHLVEPLARARARGETRVARIDVAT